MTLRLRDDVSLTEAEDGGGVLLNERSGEYWQLNLSGFTTLRMGLADADEQIIAHALVPDGAPAGVEQALLDIRELIEELVSAGLVTRS
ncbi:PqqD family peptide modification chaperone [Amycolatopsis azurea]|uniref:Coenzyme PQQ synthesis protein D (PqqD) n=1 Tax=Amycolatopsis azurea DSM 43854 TaxID=1238180 RepID=M2NPK2_9PSEU|nr:PqqD family peptide modification chaperone [Amycolatopsis azurea]EMD24179.1 hypothetical protein C791_6257 [Amycolatopsis azurea DSM 43854]OOC07993.1 hypothetical protein B0293_03660 [Amycolatopsis azurea DSM 43854]